ncbi:hypothetical protein [Vogesella indigofera]|uniref:hypothetical protein n=1 Tax=Vogesella indigofera TaxID=45465 RepID=UPI00234E11BD|nr:hypothetical protein [Vogesella indigofera]MDC7704042.1 hypothetical protein [Vogesella indigofera]
MKKLTTSVGVFGPYLSIETDGDGYRVDGGGLLPFIVVGKGVISDAVEGEFPPAAPDPAAMLDVNKAARQAEVDAIVVTTAAGNAFDGDERSQERMSRALAALDDGESVTWVLHDNTVASIGKAELREALRLAGATQTTIWVRPYL